MDLSAKLADAAKYDASCASSGSSKPNFCLYDCLYRINRQSSDVRRARFTPDEVVQLTLDFYRRNYIEGLFLSSGIIRNPDYTMEQVVSFPQLARSSTTSSPRRSVEQITFAPTFAA